MHNDNFTILRIDGSARYADSASRRLADEAVDRLRAAHPGARLLRRDLGRGLPLLTEAWVAANFTDPEQRSPDQRRELALSDILVEELQAADAVVMAVPMYNFGVPAAVKAWIDLVCRARVTFRYTPNGPQGLLRDRPVYLVMTTGGVPVGGPLDYASEYLRHVWGFLGVRDVHLITADGLNSEAGQALARAREQLRRAIVARAAA
ncbi:MAG: NAD(P)H-dependent oxidoreductase [Gammaproteobacteria bacterium]